MIDSLSGVMGSSDTLFVYLWGHGGANGDPLRSPPNITHTCLGVRSDTGSSFVQLWDTTFGRMMSAIHCGWKVYIMSQCFCGGFVDDLIGPHAQILCASKEWSINFVADNKSKNGSPVPEMDSVPGSYQYHGEFNFHFLNSIRGRAYYGPHGADAYVPYENNSWHDVYTYIKYRDSQEQPLWQDTTFWSAASDMPFGTKHKRVNGGGCLAASDDTAGDTLYALKGGGTYEFYSYCVKQDAWATSESIPAYGLSGKKKWVNRGGALAVAGDKVYATKGDNTYEFWCYDPSQPLNQRWSQLSDVPLGTRPLKEGTGLAAVSTSDSNYIYLLKGSGTTEFYRYNVDNESWATMAPAPAGALNKGFRDGSCLAYDGCDTIYALRSGGNEFCAYSISGNTWTTKDALRWSATRGRRGR